MDISKYVASLLPSFESSRIKDTIDGLAKELDELTVPSAQALSSVIAGDWKWKDSLAKDLDKEIKSRIKHPRQLKKANSVEMVYLVLQNLQSTLPFIKGEVDKVFGKEVSNVGLTFNKATLMQYVECAEYFVKYSRTFLNYVSAAELNELADYREVIGGVGPDDADWLKLNKSTFGVAANIMIIEVKDLKKEVGYVPDMIIDEENLEETKVVVGASRLDPFGFARLPFPISAVYHIRMSIANWQIDKYEEAKAQAKAIEFRIILMQQVLEGGEGDAAVERSLEIQEERLVKLKRKIAKMEEDYELA